MENAQLDLTPAQRSLLDHLRERHARGDAPPTLPELCAQLGLRSRGSLHKQVQALIDAGLAEPMDGRQRGVRLTEAGSEHAGCIPLLGRIAAGRPLDLFPASEPVQVPSWMLTRPDCFLLEVRGDSMIDAGILDGDWVIVEPRAEARSGELVVALVDGEAATLKRFEKRGAEILLHPENPAHETQVYAATRVQVQGVVVAQMRRYGRVR